jgi:hypothetical protein
VQHHVAVERMPGAVVAMGRVGAGMSAAEGKDQFGREPVVTIAVWGTSVRPPFGRSQVRRKDRGWRGGGRRGGVIADNLSEPSVWPD